MLRELKFSGEDTIRLKRSKNYGQKGGEQTEDKGR
jgi:hypothetical protein